MKQVKNTNLYFVFVCDTCRNELHVKNTNTEQDAVDVALSNGWIAGDDKTECRSCVHKRCFKK